MADPIKLTVADLGDFADVEIIPAPGTAIHVDDWGELIHHGQTVLALATVTQEQTPNGPIAEPLAHRYPLGALRPGHHVFVFKTDLAHCAIVRFRVPGMEGDPIEDWEFPSMLLTLANARSSFLPAMAWGLRKAKGISTGE